MNLGIVPSQSRRHVFVTYTCRHCAEQTKTFAIASQRDKDDRFAMVTKMGEFPAFGLHTPPKLKAVVEEDRETFKKGQKAEALDLGIGAFAYYRRVVESQKSRLLAEIVKVAEVVNAPPDMIAKLEAAKSETQFKKAIGEIKPAVPESLLIGGENPLTILHHALSEGLHAESDEECLELAQTIRFVLTELSERMATLLAEKRELKDAVDKLMARRSRKSQGGSSAPKGNGDGDLGKFGTRGRQPVEDGSNADAPGDQAHGS